MATRERFFVTTKSIEQLHETIKTGSGKHKMRCMNELDRRNKLKN